ncbi:hypothetical protein PAUR_a2813 [Pseudoalteromonas aurantia 208]|uniref:Uncharacterized protein n=1 Tax=Pseudoalteromonas aurantia 208 TaxID=1314867 RepID=A0ABR9EDI9_9GAMM|nr:hypothetical protein [Pseudoalteromonas aurantia 208]
MLPILGLSWEFVPFSFFVSENSQRFFDAFEMNKEGHHYVKCL